MKKVVCIITSKKIITDEKLKKLFEDINSLGMKIHKKKRLGKSGFELILNKFPNNFIGNSFYDLEVDVNFLSVDNYKKKKLILISDFDGTIVKCECIDEISQYNNSEKKVYEITKLAMEGKLNFKESLIKRVSLLKGLHITKLQDCLDKKIFLNSGADTLFKTMKSRGATTVIVSGGFSFFAEKIGKDLHADYVFSNKLLFQNQKLTGMLDDIIIDNKKKLEIMNNLCFKKNCLKSEIISVGDGANDIEIIKNAGMGVAFNAKEILQNIAKLKINFSDLTGLLYLQGIKEKEFIK